ncbi:hypothetical protein FHY31_004294 [Xanthomonas euvesicatoria]|uniref:Uncharacterized protein n=1 Tax=Xanthomonas euvesicatoria TaxID=456327 RepID=A0AAW3UA37_XANEU|nr:hypothetical protein [Xanthomonas euvesicatoria]MBB4872473.1 hypothetical protein [Xanthomonas euvesicatoria]
MQSVIRRTLALLVDELRSCSVLLLNMVLGDDD